MPALYSATGTKSRCPEVHCVPAEKPSWIGVSEDTGNQAEGIGASFMAACSQGGLACYMVRRAYKF